MCTDAMQSENKETMRGTVMEGKSSMNTKKPSIRFSFMGRNVEDLTDDEYEDNQSFDNECHDENVDTDTDELNDQDEVEDAMESKSLEDEKRMIRKQLLQISSQLGQLTNSNSELAQSKKRRPQTFPMKKEKEKILSIRISLPQESKNGSRKRAKSTHTSPNTVMSTTSLQSFGLRLGSESETDSIDSSIDKAEKDPFSALQGIASATPTACNGIGSSRQHNNESVISSGLVASFQLPAWRLAPEIDLPQFRIMDDYGDADPYFGPGYDFLSAKWAKGRINFEGPKMKKKKVIHSMDIDDNEEFIYQKSYRTSKRRSTLNGVQTASDIEDTSDAVYKKLHQSQEKAEKERMTSLYKKGLQDVRDDFSDPLKSNGLSAPKL